MRIVAWQILLLAICAGGQPSTSLAAEPNLAKPAAAPQAANGATTRLEIAGLAAEQNDVPAKAPALSAPACGSLLVIRGGNKLIRAWTSSEITHVALVVMEEGVATVYEATPAKVRKLPLAAYQLELAKLKGPEGKPLEAGLMQPKQPLQPEETAQFTAILHDQLGKRYSVRDYVWGNESEGTHCAEFASRALSATGRHQFSEPYAIAPGKLVELLAPHYTPLETLPAPAVRPANRTWCQQTWECCAGSLSWCHWACGEGWAWCQ